MDTSNRRKKLIYRQNLKRIKELETAIRNHPEKMKSVNELLEVKEDEIKEKYEEKLARAERKSYKSKINKWRE